MSQIIVRIHGGDREFCKSDLNLTKKYIYKTTQLPYTTVFSSNANILAITNTLTHVSLVDLIPFILLYKVYLYSLFL